MFPLYKKAIAGALAALFVTFTFAQECGVVYVVPNGAAAGAAGTRATPANLQYGLTLATGANNHLWLAMGTYTIGSELMLTNNMIIEGGYDPANGWIKSNTTTTTIHRTQVIVLPPPANGTAIIAGVSVSGFRLQDLTLTMDIPNGVAATAYGIYLNGCSNYNIVRCFVTSANGTPGTAGAPGTPGLAGSPGAPGNPGNGGQAPVVGGAGGVGGNNGGNGATVSDFENVAAGSAGAGGAGCGGGGGAGGDGPQCVLGCFGGPPSCNSTTPGQPGSAGGTGVSGANGAIGAPGTVAIPGYYIPGSAGANGTSGTPGCGGGGGGGGGGRQQNGSDDWGGSGGGGGGGGFGGNGGTGGTGGGGSFAIFLYNNGAGGNITDCLLTAGNGGAGGTGGAGSTGGGGGAGGAGGPAGPCPNGVGGAGGAGGAGGSGGSGGNGASGTSAALSQNGGTPVTQTNPTVPGNPPVIQVMNRGCTNAEVIFTTPVSGNWNFGAGSSPATATGAGPLSVFYTSVGRKTITLDGTAFTDFVDIFSTTAFTNTITHSNSPAITGCPDTFSTTIPGTLFEWNFGASSIPPTATSPTPSVPMAFTTTGTFTVEVWVTTACCGRVRDTVVVNVTPNTLAINLAASANSVCAGQAITYTATPASYLNYTFLVNDIPMQNSASNTFTTSALTPGDSVRVLGFDGVCFSNPSATLFPTINPIPIVTLTSSDADNTICSGDAVTFTAAPSGYDAYEFFNNGTSVQNSAADTWTGNLASPNSVTVIATDNGCPSTASAAIVTVVNPTPAINLTVAPSATICAGDNATVTATPAGLDNYDFSVNGTSVQNTTTATYSSSTFANGDVITVTGSLNGCAGIVANSITMTVNPIPTVTLTSSDADNSICQGVSVTFTASPAGYDTYDFANNGTSVQSSASETYTTNLLTNPNSITVTATDLGCTSATTLPIVTTVQPAPVVDAGSNQSACVDAGTQTLAGFSPAGGNWTGNGITNPTGDFDPAIASAGNHSLVYSYTDAITGCAGLDSIVFTVNALPTIVTQSSVDICETQSAQLTASGAVNYLWSPAADLNASNIANPVATPLLSTLYTVTATDANNCSNTATTQVNVNANPIANFTTTEVCQGLNTIFANNSTPVNGTTYVWYFGDGTTSTLDNPLHAYTAADTFGVTLIATNGNCIDSFISSTTVHPVATADFTATPLASYNDDASPVVFNNLSTNSDQWNWSFGDQTFSTVENPAHVYQQPGTYSVTLYSHNQYGCSDTAYKENYITIYQKPTVFIPNVFTPNGDGQNDKFLVYANGVRYFELSVFNRWGEKVYEGRNFLDGWDGTYQGKTAQPGVYTYVLKIVFDDNSDRKMKGSVTLVL